VSSDFLAGAGLLALSAAAAAALVLPRGRGRCAAMAAVVLLAPAIVLGDQWHSSLITDLRNDSGRLIALGLTALIVIGGLFAVFRRWPLLLPLAVIAALPFRIPLHGGGDQANLLLPLYLVIAAGALLAISRDWEVRRPKGPARAAIWLPRLLALFVVLYALQALYSEDFSRGLQNVCFFLAPFALVFALLGDFHWDRRLLGASLAIVAAEALVFAAVGFVEYSIRELIWNEAVIRSNEFHVYFRVNSLFWDPNVYGRYLAIAIVLVVAVLLWTREGSLALALAGLSIVLWLGLATTFSQSSFAALLAGLATLAALRWSLRWTLAIGAVAAVAALSIAVAAGESLQVDLSTDNEANKETTGRYNLVSGGAELFADRPLWGYGSGSFSRSFRRHVAGARPPVSESHTEPVTVAAEQGLIGLTAYLAILAAAFWVLCSGLREAMPGLRRDPSSAPPSMTGPEGRAAAVPAVRAAILAAFIALLVHTMAYAGFFEDPITWVLLAIGLSLSPLAARSAA
jgi:O-antigen ligase